MTKDYFARDALSNSGIKELLRSPGHYRHWLNNPKDDSSALRVGRAFHERILEPEKNSVLVFTATKTLNSKAGDAFIAQNPGKIILTEDEAATVYGMVEAMKLQVTLMEILEKCERELEIYRSVDTQYGLINGKAMLDAVNPFTIWDLKTTDESADDFEWTAKRYKYDVQAAWYQKMGMLYDGRYRDFCFIVVEKKPPHGILIYQAGEEMIARGWDKCMVGMERYARAKSSGLWPTYDINVIRKLN